MTWEIPSFLELKMDAEINSYQDDFKDISDLQEQSEEVRVSADDKYQHDRGIET